VLDALDAAGVRAWSRAALELVAEHRAEIDALNVFPVPDSDTGANMLATLRAADDALAATDADDADVWGLLDAWAAGGARGAVGNSGFIVSQVLCGLAEAAAGTVLDGAALAAGLGAGAVLGRSAVVEPVEGTILTVARAAADAAVTTARDAASGTLAEVARAAFDSACEALAHTPSQLAALRRAGVVDAGGRGLVVVLGALVQVVTGTPVTLPAVHAPEQAPCAPDTATFGFEVQYLLDADAPAVDRLRAALHALGDSVVVVPVSSGWNVHVHVDDVGAAIEAGVEAGRPHQISVTELRRATAAGAFAVLAVAPGPGLAHLFEREGVHVVESHEPDDLPTVAQVLDAIADTGAREVVLLPNASRVTGVAEAAAEASRAGGVRVAVVPTHSPVQGLAAIAVHDPGRGFDDDVVAMAEAAAATRWAEIVTAREEALTAVGICHPGDVLGLIDGEVVELGSQVADVALGVVDRLLGVGGELMTVLVGADAPGGVGELLAAHVRERSPFIEVAVYAGGRPELPVVIGLE